MFCSALLLSKLSWLNVFSNLIGFYASIQHSIHHSRKSPDIRSEALLSIKKFRSVLHILFCFVAVSSSLLKKWKEKSSDAARERVLFYMKHTDKFTSSKSNLLVFQVKTNSAWDSGLLGSQCYNFRHLQHSSSSHAAALLTCFEDMAQNYLSHCFSYIPKICTIVLFLPF